MNTRFLARARVLLAVALGAIACAGSEASTDDTAGAAGAGVTRRADAELLQAARTGDLTLLQARLEAGADVNAVSVDGTTPLIEAAAGGQVKAAEALIEAGADIDANQRGWGSPLDAAERAGHTELANLLREKGAHSASGRSVGDTVCVRPWDGDGYCGTVEAASRATYRIRITEVVGCATGCPARGECSADRPVGGRDGLRAGDAVDTVSWCLTHTGVIP